MSEVCTFKVFYSLDTYLYLRFLVQTQNKTKNKIVRKMVTPIVDNTAIPSDVCGHDVVLEITASVDGSTDVTGKVANVGVVKTEAGVPSLDSRNTFRIFP
jgi:hypothetical protein